MIRIGSNVARKLVVCLIVLAVDQLSVGCAAAQPAFQKVFELPPANRGWFASVLADDGNAWTAGGREFLVVGSDAEQKVLPLPSAMMSTFGKGLDGATYAAGSNGSIWRRVNRQDWRLENRVGPTSGRHKGLDDALLIGIGVAESATGTMLAAYGPGALVFVRGPQGAWAPPADKEQAEQLYWRLQDGPSASLPSDCQRTDWRPFDKDGGFVMCKDRRGFVVQRGVVSAAGRLPKACDVLLNVARRGGELFAACGVNGAVFHWRSDASWGALSVPKGVRALSANAQCVVVATEREVWRSCLK